MPETQIVCLSLSHHTAALDVREQLHNSLRRPHGKRDPVFPTLSGEFAAISEFVILSTCNRMEMYACVNGDMEDVGGMAAAFLAQAHGVVSAEFRARLNRYHGNEAIAHLLRVAAGLDSLVLGEAQILGQVTAAYMAAVKAHTIGPIFSAIFRSAIRAGKRARAETTISHNPASISSVAVAQARTMVDDLRQSRILVVGAGEMGQLAIKALRARGVTQIAIANRTPERVKALATEWGGKVYGLDQLATGMAEADVIITATGAQSFIIDTKMVADAMASRNGQKMVLIDIAAPRNMDPAVGNLPAVHLIDVDRLQSNLAQGLAERQEQIPRVEEIIEEELEACEAQLQTLSVRPLIVDLRHKAEQIRQRELDRTLRYLNGVDEETLAHIQKLSQSLVNKLLHEPTMILRKEAGDGNSAEYAATVRDLFGLE